MKEHPILFSGEMVRAILEGRKTQTRRVVKHILPTCQKIWRNGLDSQNSWGMMGNNGNGWTISCPYGNTGDHLWVREKWRIVGWSEDGDWCIEYKDGFERWFDSVQDVDEDTGVRYWMQCTDDCIKAGIPEDENGDFRFDNQHPCPTRWRPSIHMPRWASRIALEIVNIRVERLQDISRDDAMFEGVQIVNPYKIEPDLPPGFPAAFQDYANPNNFFTADPVASFRSLWGMVNEKRNADDFAAYQWNANPWVWVVEFRKL